MTVTRKLFFIAAGWIFGLLLFLKFGAYAIIASAAAGITAAAFFSRSKYLRFAVAVSAAAVLGSAYFTLYSKLCCEKITAFDGKEITVDGAVTDFECSDGSARITVCGRINGGVKATVTFYLSEDNFKDFDYYEKVSVKGRVAVPENTVGFDSEDYLFSRGVYLQGKGTAECTLKGGCSNYPLRAIKHLRDYTVKSIINHCRGQSGAFLAAILCSDKSRLSASSKGAVYRSGLGHLFAVSGTHVVILGAFLEALITKIFASPKIRSAVLLAVIWAFAVFAGLSPSIVRACIMMSVSLTAAFFRRRADSANSLGAAAILITLHCPYSLTSVSFVMSFTAAFAIGVIAPALCSGRVTSNAMRSLVSYVCINICTLPLCAYYFSEISVVSVFSNILLLPMCTSALTLSFAYMITGSKFTALIKLADFFAGAVLKYCGLITKSDFAYIGTHSVKTLVVSGIIALEVLICLALKKKKSGGDVTSVIAVYMAICIEMSAVSRFPVKDRIIIIPDGSAYTAVVVSGNTAAVFDVGSCGNRAYNVNSLLEEYHVTNSYFFISEQAVFTCIVYKNQLYDSTSFYSLSNCEPAVNYLGGKIETASLSAEPSENGFTVGVGGSEIQLSENEIFVNGSEYIPSSFERTSTIIL